MADDDFTSVPSGKKTKRKIEKQDDLVSAGKHFSPYCNNADPGSVVSGTDAIQLYLQCTQLILWKQAYWLIHTKGYPEELLVRGQPIPPQHG